jgi:hypothetical protein
MSTWPWWSNGGAGAAEGGHEDGAFATQPAYIPPDSFGEGHVDEPAAAAADVITTLTHHHHLGATEEWGYVALHGRHGNDSDDEDEDDEAQRLRRLQELQANETTAWQASVFAKGLVSRSMLALQVVCVWLNVRHSNMHRVLMSAPATPTHTAVAFLPQVMLRPCLPLLHTMPTRISTGPALAHWSCDNIPHKVRHQSIFHNHRNDSQPSPLSHIATTTSDSRLSSVALADGLRASGSCESIGAPHA